MHVRSSLGDVAQRGRLERAAILFLLCHFKPSPILGAALRGNNAEVMELVVREVRALMARRARTLADEDQQSALLLVREDVLFTADITVEPGIAGYQRALIGGNCFSRIVQ